MTRFAEDQRFSPAIMAVIFALTLLVGMLMTLLLPPDAVPGEQPSALFTLLIVPAMVTALAAAVLFLFRLRIRVEEDRLAVSFLFGLRRTIPLSEIRSAEAVNYRPLRDFGGWGVRFGRQGMIYSTRGNRAVRLSLENGKVVFIGSQKPEELAQAIMKAGG